MKENLRELQRKSQHSHFADRLTDFLILKNVDPTPVSFSSAFNSSHKNRQLKPHTVRQWLLGISQPRSETLILLANWLEVEPESLFIKKDISPVKSGAIEFDFEDKEVITKYLTMTVKQKAVVKQLVDVIVEKNK